MQKFIITFSFLFLQFINVQAQELIGYVKDSLNNPIPLANIQLLEKNTSRSVFFSQTNNEGQFIIRHNNIDLPAKLKITHLSFENKEIEINNYSSIIILLNSKTTKLKEVVIESRAFDISETNDTIKYNLKKLLNGSEIKLKDILEKLPGLSLDENGKIRFNGKKIDNLLLDGDEFFKDNHQLATENITSEMVEKIELLKNYQKFSSIKDFESSGITALNIKLNNKFKDQFKGNIDMETGISKRYRTHNNFYNFGKKTKLSLITNLNNINNNIVSVTDYLALKKENGRKFIEEKDSGSEIITEEDLPAFLFSEDNAKSKSLKNYTFNFSNKINTRKRIEFVSIFNQIDQIENKISNQYFFDENTSEVLKTEKSKGYSIFFYNNLKYENKLNEKNYFSTNSYFLAGKDFQNDLLSNFIIQDNSKTLFNNNLELNNLKFGYNLHLKSKFSKKLLLEGMFYNDFKINNTKKNINSNLELTQFSVNENTIIQNTKLKTISFGFKGKSTLKFKKGNLTSILMSLYDNEQINNKNSIEGNYNFSNSFFRTNNSASLKYSSTIFKEKTSYSLGLTLLNNKLTIHNKETSTITSILPTVSIGYNFNKEIKSSIGLNSNFENSTILSFLSGNIINNYRSELINNNDLEQKKIINNSYQFSLSFNKPKSNFFSLLNIIYNQKNRSLDKTFINNNLLTQEKFNYLNLDNSLFSFIIIEKKSTQIPYGFSFQSLNSKMVKNTFVNLMESENHTFQNKINMGIKSYYNKNDFNLSLGIEYLNSVTKNIQLNTKNKFENISPYIKFNGVIFNDKLNWSVSSNYHIFKTSNSIQNNIFDLGFKFNYNLKKSTIYINGANILNIQENNFKNSISSNQLFVEEIKLNSLSGFLNVGYSFSF